MLRAEGEIRMELSDTDVRLKSIGRIDLFRTDEKYNFKLTDILRKRQPPPLIIIDRDGNLVFSSLPSSTAPADSLAPTDELLAQVQEEAKRLLREERPVASVVRQLVINKPGERCALIVIENEFYCLRLFPLTGPNQQLGDMYATLVEAISDPRLAGVDLSRVKGLFRLSKREIDVLDALMLGGTDKEIAVQVGLGVETVRAYLKSIRAKLGVKTRTAIVSLVHGLHAETNT